MSLVSMFVFPAPQSSYTVHSFPNELLWIPLSLADARPGDGSLDYGKCQTGDAVPAVILRSPAARFLIIYLHSNGEDIGLAYPFGCGLRMVLEVHVLLVEYPGYGICPGQCSEDALWQAAQAAFRFATDTLKWPLEDVIIMGRSLGAAVAMRLACTHACHGLILVAPFLSLVEAVSQYVGSLAPMFVGNSFCNKDFISRVEMPTLVIHGMNDRLVSCSQGQQLWEMCPHKKKLFVCPEQMSHNSDLLSNADFLIRPMLRFFALPDYSFVDLEIPAEAFDKRHCPQYHTLVETMKDDRPLRRPQGDKEPCPIYATMGGPQSAQGPMVEIGGDDDDLEGSNEDNVQSRGGSPNMSNRSLLPTASWKLDEKGLRLPSELQAQIAATSPHPDSGPASIEPDMSDPRPELTEEMLGGLNNFLRGGDQRSPSAIGLRNASPGTPSSHGRTSGPALERALPPDLGLDLGPVGDMRPPFWSIGVASSRMSSPESKTDSIEVDPMPEEQDADPVPEEQDADWAVHAGKEPTFMCGKPTVTCRPSDPEAYSRFTNDDEAVPATTPASAADAARLWEEGSTAVPSTAEASVSRWSEHTSDPECKAAPVPGLCILNLDNGITRFLHEADNAEEDV